MKRFLALAFSVLVTHAASSATILVEAESFTDPGGWSLDTQFIEVMGSPYLLAHGLGKPVADAVTTVKVPQAGSYRVFVRTKDWVAPWGAPGTPGRFELRINGKALASQFGTVGADWNWQQGESVNLPAGEIELALHDLTGFDGRCDAIILTSDAKFMPPAGNDILPAWRRELLGVPAQPIEVGPYDLVVAGGGYAGVGAALGAARMGCKVALIQNRPVLGGNGSSEVRVWAQGNMPDGDYPLRDIVMEFMDRAKKSPGTFEEFGDAKKESVVTAEANIDLYLNHHAFAVQKTGNHITAIDALDTRSNAIRRFNGRLFVDATGHGYIGYKAGADHNMEEKGRMGMSNMWSWQTGDAPQQFPATPWALDLGEADFPYPRRGHAEWFWESGFDKHPLNDLERIRDWNLRAAFGAWNAIKNKGAFADRDETGKKHENSSLEWLAYVGGTRETLQLLGDVIVTKEDILSNRQFPDGCVLSTWSIDLHYPKRQYATKVPDNPFISEAQFGDAWDRKRGYAFPYRAFYSRNIDNLFMAGRCLSVTHEALGTIRVMKTLGMVGVAVGRAAEIARRHNCTPREVYTDYLTELQENLRLPGSFRRPAISEPAALDPTLPPPGRAPVSSKGQDPAKLPGIIVDDSKAKTTGKWSTGDGLPDFIAQFYSYTGAGDSTMTFTVPLPKPGKYEVRFGYTAHENRATNTAVTVKTDEGDKSFTVNEKLPPKFNTVFHSLGVFKFAGTAEIVVSAEGANGTVCVDAVQLLPVE